MGYEAINFNANLFALPQAYSGNDYAYAASPNPLFSIFNFQPFQPPTFQTPYYFLGLELGNNYNWQMPNYSFQNYMNIGMQNNYANFLYTPQVNFKNSINQNYSGFRFSIPEYSANNIFATPAKDVDLYDTEATEDKRIARDGLGAAVATKASSYIGKVNSDAEGNRLFSGGRNQAWCQDFVSWILGAVTNKLPKVMTTTSSPIVFRDKADKMGCYNRVPSSNRVQWAKNNIHKGDVIIKSGKGQSGLHVAIALDVKDDGTIIAVSGNSSDSVKRNTYNINKGDIYGIVDIERLARA